MDGRVGFDILKSTGYCCINLPKKTLTFHQSFEELPIKNTIKATFEEIYNLIFLTFETELGPKKFFLDTGASHSLIRDQPFRVKIKHLIINNHDFGPWNFLSIPITDLAPGDGILGVDFFQKHAFSFDFQNKTVYIHP